MEEKYPGSCHNQRDYRDGWPQRAAVETEVNGDSKSTNDRGPFLVSWACRACTRDFCSAFAALASPLQINFSFTVHYFNSFVPTAQQAGQAAVLGRLSLIVCVSGHNHGNLVNWQTWKYKNTCL